MQRIAKYTEVNVLFMHRVKYFHMLANANSLPLLSASFFSADLFYATNTVKVEVLHVQ